MALTYRIEGVHHQLGPTGARVMNDRGISERGDLLRPVLVKRNHGQASYNRQRAAGAAER